MEAPVVAADCATRLGELTRDRPKSFLPVGLRPIIDCSFCQLAEIERVSVIINDRFAAQFAQLGSRAHFP